MSTPPTESLAGDETYRLRVVAKAGRYREADRVLHDLRMRSRGQRSRHARHVQVVAAVSFALLCLAILYLVTATFGDGIDHFAPLSPVAIAVGARLGWWTADAVQRLFPREVEVRFEGADGVVFGEDRLGPLVRVEADPAENLLRLGGEDWKRELVMEDPESPVRIAAQLQAAVSRGKASHE